jgi:uncharacterized protein
MQPRIDPFIYKEAREPFTVMRTEENYIPTYTGLKFWPLNPRVQDICIEDIAHSLSLECRFTGHTYCHYSVADHSLRVSSLAESLVMLQPGPLTLRIEAAREAALWGLLHDASEAYLKDLPSPVKHAPGIGVLYKQYERNLMDAIALRFDLAPHEPSVVKDADRILLATEARDLITLDGDGKEHGRWSQATPLPETIFPLDAQHAEVKFLRRFEKLTAALERERVITPEIHCDIAAWDAMTDCANS